MVDSEHIETGPGPATLPEPIIKQGWLRALIFILVYPFLLLVQALLMLAVTSFEVTSVEDFVATFDKPIMIAGQAVLLLVTLVYIWLFRHFIDRRSLVSLGLHFEGQVRRDFMAGLLWGAGMATAVFALLWMFGLAQVQSVKFPVGSLVTVAVIMVLVAAQEELLLRGYMLNNLMQSANKYLSLLLVSVLFSVEHALNPNLTLVGLLNIVLAGMFLGIYYIHRKNLWFPIGLHFTWNCFQGAIFGSPVSGIQIPSVFVVEFAGNDDLSGGGFGFEGSLMLTVVAVTAIIILHFIYRQPRDMAKGGLSESPQREP